MTWTLPLPPAWAITPTRTRVEATQAQCVPEGQRNTYLASLAGVMRRRGAGYDAISAALAAENAARCAPPLSDSEVERIALSIRRYSPAEALWVSPLTSRMRSDATTTPVPSETIFAFRTAREVAEETPEAPEFMVGGYIAVGSITLLVGKAKSAGKTTLLMHAIRAVLDGFDFLENPTLRSPIVYLSEERNGTLRQSLRRAGLLDRDDLVFLQWHATKGVEWPDVVNQAVAECHRRGARLLVVDTITQFAGLRGDAENNAGDVQAALEPLQEAASTGLAVALLHHEGKTPSRDVGESGRGSSVFAAAVDVIVSMRRAEGQGHDCIRVLRALSRYDETPDELVIELTEDGYCVRDRAAVAVGDAREAIVRAAPTAEADAVTEKDLLDLVPATSRSTIREAMEALRAEGILHRAGRGKKGDPYLYWIHSDGTVR